MNSHTKTELPLQAFSHNSQSNCQREGQVDFIVNQIFMIWNENSVIFPRVPAGGNRDNSTRSSFDSRSLYRLWKPTLTRHIFLYPKSKQYEHRTLPLRSPCPTLLASGQLELYLSHNPHLVDPQPMQPKVLQCSESKFSSHELRFI